MLNKKQVLIVTNAITDEELVQIKQTFNEDIDERDHINLSIVHVIPRLPTCYFNIPSMSLLIEKYHQEAKEALKQIGGALNVAKHDQWLISGKIRTEVLRLATALDANFVLASAAQLNDMQRSLFFKPIHEYTKLARVNVLQMQT